MFGKFVDLRVQLQALALVISLAMYVEPCCAQGIEVRIEKDLQVQTITMSPRNGSSVQVKIVGDGETTIEVRENAIWWDIRTEEGMKHLTRLLNEKAKRCLDAKVDQEQLSEQQTTKLKVAAGVQVARDRRAIIQLAMAQSEPNANNQNLGFWRAQEMLDLVRKIDELIEAGIDRKNSLFVKVLNNLK